MKRLRTKRPWGRKKDGNLNRNVVTDVFYLKPFWRILRRSILRDEPGCRVCRIYEGIPKKATVLDHFRPRRLWPELETAKKNLMPICDHHHAIKSGMERHCKTQGEWIQKVLPKFRLCDK